MEYSTLKTRTVAQNQMLRNDGVCGAKDRDRSADPHRWIGPRGRSGSGRGRPPGRITIARGCRAVPRAAGGLRRGGGANRRVMFARISCPLSSPCPTFSKVTKKWFPQGVGGWTWGGDRYTTRKRGDQKITVPKKNADPPDGENRH